MARPGRAWLGTCGVGGGGGGGEVGWVGKRRCGLRCLGRDAVFFVVDTGGYWMLRVES